MSRHMTIGGLAEAAVNANLEANAPPTRAKGLRRASRWAERAYADGSGTTELSLRSLEDLQKALFLVYEEGKISQSTFQERRRLVADMLDLAEFGSIGRSATLSPSWKKGDNPLSRPVPDEVRNDSGSIVGLSLAVLDEMARNGYSTSSIRCYRMCALPRLISHFMEHGTDRYSDEVLDSFIERVDGGWCSEASFRLILRPAALHVRSVHDAGTLHVRSSTVVQRAEAGPYGQIMGEFVSWRRAAGMKERTIEHDVEAIVPFLEHLCPEGPEGLGAVTRKGLRSALAAMFDGREPRYVCRALTSVRALAAFVEERHPELPAFGGWVGRNPRVVRRRPIEGYTTEQAEAMIASADQSTDMGVRDRAILLLMATTGMRACDVVTLTLDDIDWRANEISVRQEKTGVALALPLDVRTGEAIARYILGARRDCDGREVFVTTMGAARPLLATSINYIVRKYSPAADAAGFTGVHGPHAFRRGLGAAMVNSGASLAEAAEVLGHSRAESAIPYASMATDRLRSCSVGLGDLPNEGKGADDGRLH